MRATGPGQPAHLLLDVIDTLNRNGIRYGLIGAFAVSYYGLPRHTNDADVVVWLSGTGVTPESLPNLIIAAGYRSTWRRPDFDDPLLGVINVSDQYENTVDLILGIRGLDPDAEGRCHRTVLLDSPVRVIAVEDLVPMKLFAGGVQDVDDVKGILQVSAEHIDLDLTRRLAAAYGADVLAMLTELTH